MAETRPTYVSYLVRFWRSEGRGATCWRARLQHAQSEGQWTFGDPEELFRFLRNQLDALAGCQRDSEEDGHGSA